MKAKFPIPEQINNAIITTLILTLGAVSVLLCSPTDSRAQQEPNRQLVQTGSANATFAKRVALVIGNGAYTTAPALKNPPNDARDMAVNLKMLGFDVSIGVNVSQREMKRLIREFGQKLKTGGNGLFYYAGHGVQARGRNYIIPIDAEIQSEADVEDSGVDVGLVLNYMDDAQNGLNIVILDACRNNPFARSFRSASDGLAQVDAPTGTLIAYATAPGRVAADGVGENGLYTSELLKAMRLPGLSASDMFMRVRAEVMKKTGNKQVPWEASSLVGTFYFAAAPAGRDSSISANSNEPGMIDSVAVEREYWETIRGSNNVEDYKEYIQTYPLGAYAAIARTKIRQLEVAKSAPLPNMITQTPMARFRFNGDAINEGTGDATFTLKNTEFRNIESGRRALYLNGVYEHSSEPNAYHAVLRTPELTYSRWTVAIRFKGEFIASSKTSILVGGTSYRWFGIGRSAAGNLYISFNNNRFAQELPVTLLPNKWTVVVCGFDLTNRKAVVYFNGTKVAEVDLPHDFKLDIIDVERKEKGKDKEWAFTNYSNGSAFHGLVSDLMIYDRVLAPEEFGNVPLRP